MVAFVFTNYYGLRTFAIGTYMYLHVLQFLINMPFDEQVQNV